MDYVGIEIRMHNSGTNIVLLCKPEEKEKVKQLALELELHVEEVEVTDEMVKNSECFIATKRQEPLQPIETTKGLLCKTRQH